MSRFSLWVDRKLDPSGHEHLVDDADEALHPLVVACLLVIAFVVVVAAITWFFTLPVDHGELAPVSGTTTTEAQP